MTDKDAHSIVDPDGSAPSPNIVDCSPQASQDDLRDGERPLSNVSPLPAPEILNTLKMRGIVKKTVSKSGCNTGLLHSSVRTASITIRNGVGKSGGDCYTRLLHNNPIGLVLRHPIFCHRRRVPHDIRAIVERAELWKSLRTDSKTVSIRRFRQL